MLRRSNPPSVAELRRLFRPFCEKHHIRRLEVFGSTARDQAAPGSDVDLLVTLDDSKPVSTADLLEMAGEAEQLGRLQDILTAARLIASYVQGVAEVEFHANTQKQDAVVRRLEIIGEA